MYGIITDMDIAECEDFLDDSVPGREKVVPIAGHAVTLDYVAGSIGDRPVYMIPRRVDAVDIEHLGHMMLLSSLGAERVIGIEPVRSLRKNVKPGDFTTFTDIQLQGIEAPSFLRYGFEVQDYNYSSLVCVRSLWNYFQKSSHFWEKMMKFRMHIAQTYLNLEWYDSVPDRKKMKMTVAVAGNDMREGFAATELGMCYLHLGWVSDYMPSKRIVISEEEGAKIAVLARQKSKSVLRQFILTMPEERKCDCRKTLEGKIKRVYPEAESLLVSRLMQLGVCGSPKPLLVPEPSEGA